MATKKTRPRKETARTKLQESHLRLDQQELLGEDIDLDKFYVKIAGATGIRLIDQVLSADVERTIEGASTLTVTVEDADGSLLNSKLLHNRCDVNIDGLWFRLVKLGRQSGVLTLTFEDREISVLRTYQTPIKQSKKTSRNKGVTRAEFILRMIKEVKEFDIPYVIPDLHKTEPVEKDYTPKTKPSKDKQNQNRQYGITYHAPRPKIKKQDATSSQIDNANDILDVGEEMNVPRKVQIMAIMCCIQESSINNLPQPKPGDGNYRSDNGFYNPVGCFQQIKAYGWPATRKVRKDAAAFFTKAIVFYKRDPNAKLYNLIEQVQHSGLPEEYGTHRVEADAIVDAYYGSDAGAGGTGDLRKQFEDWFNAHGGGTGGDNEYEFFRGKPEVRGKKVVWLPQSSWDAITNLADEVNKRAFFVSGTFYYISETELFKSKARATLNEDSPGVNWIDFDWDIGKSMAECTLTCQMDRWFAPPGTVIKLINMGVVSGRWLVSTVDRSLYSKEGTITLIKPHPALPEPGGTNIEQGDTGTPQFHFKNKPDPTDKAYWTIMSSGADRMGTPTKQYVKDFVSKIAHVYGKKLTITTGTNHNQYVAGSNRQSAHWTGDAADIGNHYGADLTKLGRAALVAAGMPPQKAAFERGGLYNYGSYQIIFNSMIGGNHYNHLHVGGIRPVSGPPGPSGSPGPPAHSKG